LNEFLATCCCKRLKEIALEYELAVKINGITGTKSNFIE
jgi:hypothetical protein